MFRDKKSFELGYEGSVSGAVFSVVSRDRSIVAIRRFKDAAVYGHDMEWCERMRLERARNEGANFWRFASRATKM